jgi:hypothetical protein
MEQNSIAGETKGLTATEAIKLLREFEELQSAEPNAVERTPVPQ